MGSIGCFGLSVQRRNREKADSDYLKSISKEQRDRAKPEKRLLPSQCLDNLGLGVLGLGEPGLGRHLGLDS